MSKSWLATALVAAGLFGFAGGAAFTKDDLELVGWETQWAPTINGTVMFYYTADSEAEAYRWIDEHADEWETETPIQWGVASRLVTEWKEMD